MVSRRPLFYTNNFFLNGSSGSLGHEWIQIPWNVIDDFPTRYASNAEVKAWFLSFLFPDNCRADVNGEDIDPIVCKGLIDSVKKLRWNGEDLQQAPTYDIARRFYDFGNSDMPVGVCCSLANDVKRVMEASKHVDDDSDNDTDYKSDSEHGDQEHVSKMEERIAELEEKFARFNALAGLH